MKKLSLLVLTAIFLLSSSSVSLGSTKTVTSSDGWGNYSTKLYYSYVDLSHWKVSPIVSSWTNCTNTNYKKIEAKLFDGVGNIDWDGTARYGYATNSITWTWYPDDLSYIITHRNKTTVKTYYKAGKYSWLLVPIEEHTINI